MTQLKKFQKEIVTVFKAYDKTGTKTWDYKIAAFDLMYQLGSLTKRISQLDGERYADGLSRKEIIEKASDEIADILAEILFISDQLGIDVEKAWGNMKKSDANKIKTRAKLRTLLKKNKR